MKTISTLLGSILGKLFFAKPASILAVSQMSIPSAPANAAVEQTSSNPSNGQQPQSIFPKETAVSRKKAYRVKDHVTDARTVCIQSPSAADEDYYVSIQFGEYLRLTLDEIRELTDDLLILQDLSREIPATEVIKKDTVESRINDLIGQIKKLETEESRDFRTDINCGFHPVFKAIQLGFSKGRDYLIKVKLLKTQNEY